MFDYINSYYKLSIRLGQDVEYRGRKGIITEDRGSYVGITFDDEKAANVSPFHPLEEGLVYLDSYREPRKLTKSQSRYKRYLKYGDGFSSFKDYLYWDCSKERPWNK